MRLVVPSCWAYRDAWGPFFKLLEKFWPAHPQVYLISDAPADPVLPFAPADVNGLTMLFDSQTGIASWGPRLARFALLRSDEPILLMQEDFFLTAPVKHELVEHAVRLMEERVAGAARLYPCPGANEESGDEHFGLVKRGTEYRVSLQAALWRPSVLHVLASHCGTPTSFELVGTRFASSNIDYEILAAKREVDPWPMEYLCSAITRGLWNPDAKRLCDEHGIENDWTMRAFL